MPKTRIKFYDIFTLAPVAVVCLVAHVAGVLSKQLIASVFVRARIRVRIVTIIWPCTTLPNQEASVLCKFTDFIMRLVDGKI